MTDGYDFEVIDDGSVVGIKPLTAIATNWMADNVESEGWQWLGNTLYVDHGMAENIIGGMCDDGLVLGELC
jgi:hypothetical protein